MASSKLIFLIVVLTSCVCFIESNKIGLENFSLLKNTDSVSNTNLKFSYKSCGEDNDPAVVNSLDVKPDPIKMPGNVSLSFNASVKSQIEGPISVSVKIIKIVGKIKFTVPCIDNIGSCTYNDLCTMLPKTCPDVFIKLGIPCQCPFPAGVFAAPNIESALPQLPIKIPGGQYNIIVDTHNNNGRVVCLDMNYNFA